MLLQKIVAVEFVIPKVTLDKKKVSLTVKKMENTHGNLMETKKNYISQVDFESITAVETKPTAYFSFPGQ